MRSASAEAITAPHFPPIKWRCMAYTTLLNWQTFSAISICQFLRWCNQSLQCVITLHPITTFAWLQLTRMHYSDHFPSLADYHTPASLSPCDGTYRRIEWNNSLYRLCLNSFIRSSTHWSCIGSQLMRTHDRCLWDTSICLNISPLCKWMLMLVVFHLLVHITWDDSNSGLIQVTLLSHFCSQLIKPKLLSLHHLRFF